MMGYEPVPYWQARGATYLADYRPGVAHREQEATLRTALRNLLHRDGGAVRSVLEVGCGFGRVGAVLMPLMPWASYTGCDVSPDQLAAAQQRLPSGRYVCLPFQQIRGQWDLVVAVEVLMHMPPDQVTADYRHLRRLARRYVLTADWDKPLRPDKLVGDHNFVHDYSAMGGRYLGAAGPHQGAYLARGLA